MQQIRTVWAGLDRKKQITVILASVAVFVLVLFMSRIVSQPTMRLLYSGLESGTAGEIVRSLEQRGIAYEVRGGAIYVDSQARDELRLTLASEGLPANGGRGYELLDSLSGFGTTSQMFDAAYWRAKEGELARTIVASPFVNFARVHIANTGSNPFQRSVEPTASVSVTATGGQISAQQAEALRHLVASAVTGLLVKNVAVIDSKGNLIGSDDAPASPSTANSQAETLRDRVTRLVEARVGSGNAVVEVSVDTVTETETIKERRVDPASRVAISTDTEERSDNSTNKSTDVSVASNLPDGDAAAGDDSTAQTSETRERINYEVSQTEHEILRAPGAVKRLTVAVLVNGLPGDDAAAFTPRPEEELSALRDLVASAVGFNEERGDVITIKSMNLQSVTPLGTPASASLFGPMDLDLTALIQMAVLALVTLFLALFVVKPLLARPPATAPALVAPPADGGDGIPPALTGEIDDGAGGFVDASAVPTDGATGVALAEDMDSPVERLRGMIGERQEETVEILRTWLEDKKEEA